MKTKSQILLLVFGMLLSPMIYGAFPCQGSFSTILTPQYVTDIDNHIQAGGWAPSDQISLVTLWCGDDAVDNAASWGVNYFTGFTPASPVSNYQRCRVNANPYTAFQLQGYGAGIFLNTYSQNWINVTGGGTSAVYSYVWSQYPSIYTSSDASLMIQMNAKMPWVYRPNAGTHPNSCVPQLTITFAFNQTGTNKMLNWVVLLYEPRTQYMNYENIQWDNYNNQVFISTSLSEGRSYITRGCNSNVTQSTSWSDSKFFRFHVTRDNLINAVNTANTYLGSSYYSTNPADYKLVVARAMLEIVPWTYGTNASAGASWQNFGVYKHTF